MPHAVILGITADIGQALATRLLRDGWTVTGLGRNLSRLPASGTTLVEVDIEDPTETYQACEAVGKWDLCVSSVGTMTPIGRFFDLDFEVWQRSVDINFTAQLRVLHALWPKRTARPNVMLLAGGGTNNPMTNYSAYCVSKIALIKMVELLDDETSGANIFINGPGFTHTRIHEETLSAGDAAGAALAKTEAFLASDGGTSMDDIYNHMRWCMNHPQAASGRNFSTVHDGWRDGDSLADRLEGDRDAFRLRRAALR